VTYPPEPINAGTLITADWLNNLVACFPLVQAIPTTTINTTSASTIASQDVAASSYLVECEMTYHGSSAAGTPSFGCAGPSATDINFSFQFTPYGSSVSPAQGGLGYGSGAVEAGPTMQTSTQVWQMMGNITFTSAGTFTIIGETSSSSDEIVIGGGLLRLTLVA